MKLLEDRIIKDSIIVNNDIIKVDSFLNHQIDPVLIDALADDIISAFEFTTFDKVLTVETSGIAIAYAVAAKLKLPLVFAKKSKSQIVDDNVYASCVKSFTRNIQSTVTVSKKYLDKGTRVLIVDDFLAEGNASLGLIDICNQASATVIGVAVGIEKGFQGGRKKLEELGYPVYSGAIIKEFKDNKPVF